MSRRSAATVVGAASLIAAITLVSRVLGFGRWLVFSHEVGGTCVGQAYAAANQLPNVLYEVAAGGALAAVVVPLVGAAFADGDAERADRIGSAMLCWALAVLVPVAVLLAVVAQPLARALVGAGTPGCHAATDMTADLIRWFAPQIPLYGLGIVLTGLLQARRHFVAAAVAPILSSLVVIMCYLAYGAATTPSDQRLTGAAWWWLAGGTTAGVALLSLPLLVPARRAAIRLRPTWRLKAAERRRAAQLAGAGLIALVAQQACVVVTIWLTQHRGTTGTLNAFNYAQAIYLLPYAVLAVPIATAAFPRLTSTEGEAVLARTAPVVSLAGCLGGAVVAAIAFPVSRFFAALDAGRSVSSAEAMKAIEPGLIAWAPGLVGFGLSALLLRALYARGAAWRGGVAMAVGYALSIALPLLGVHGRSAGRLLLWLGLASSVGMTVAAVALTALVRRDWGDRATGTLERQLLVQAGAGIVAAAVGAAVGRWWGPDTLVSSMIACVVVSGLVGLTFVGLSWPAASAQWRSLAARVGLRRRSAV